MKLFKTFFTTMFFLLPAALVCAGEPIKLQEGWKLQSSKKIKATGAKISTRGFKTKGWYPTAVPSTVFAALVRNKVYPDPYFGSNFKKIPGMIFGSGEAVADKPLPESSPFSRSWWFRKEFEISDASSKEHFALHLDGINYMANIWLNGKKIAGQDQVAGTFRRFDLDVTPFINRGKANVLAVEVFAPPPHTLAYTWVDWNPSPPDKDMGIWREVWLTRSGAVALDYPKVITRFDLPSLENAHLTVLATLKNMTNKVVKGELKGTIGEVQFSQPVELKAGEEREVAFEPSEFTQLNLSHPRVWWPYQMGPQNVVKMPETYWLSLNFNTDGGHSDSLTTPFGIRQATSEMVDGKYRLFKINGKKVLIRGGGWANDLMFDKSPEREEQEIRYVRDMGLNAIRFEGPVGSENLLNLCDRYGILVMPGWQCCCHWEQWKKWVPGDQKIANESLKSVLRRLFNHPSVYVWLNGSDIAPPDPVLSQYLQVEKEEHWPNPAIGAASVGRYQDEVPSVEGPTGVKMSGPYQYVPPSYWYVDKKNGGGWGYNTETSVGPAVPPYESLQKMVSRDHLKVGDPDLIFHCARGRFSDLKTHDKGLHSRYGATKNLKEYAMKAQVMAYDGHRAMFEAYQKNKYHTATGVIQWMLNNAWPSLYWHLYDYYLRPGGAYFGAKKANEPLHVQYSYDDRSVVLVNNLEEPFKSLKVEAKVLNFDMTEVFSKEIILTAPPDSAIKAFTIPELKDSSPTYFIDLKLREADESLWSGDMKILSGVKGHSSYSDMIINENLYWLSTKREVMDWGKTEFDKTDVAEDSNMIQLNQLPDVQLKANITTDYAHSLDFGKMFGGFQENISKELRKNLSKDRSDKIAAEVGKSRSKSNLMSYGSASISLENPGKVLAFFVRLKLVRDKNGEEVLPVDWTDNFISLLPGERKNISVSWDIKDLNDQKPRIELEGWNVKPMAVK